ncbi:MAG TPA: hypothetical protein VFO62_04535, partial [Candidatus Binatia bacterium]|nr:hypothetical protein [Candidatus Binatia bacterium]
EPELTGRLEFSGAELTVYFNDRLHAPNTEECFAAVKAPVVGFFERALGAGAKLTRADDPRERLTVTARATAASDLAALASRLGV